MAPCSGISKIGKISKIQEFPRNENCIEENKNPMLNFHKARWNSNFGRFAHQLKKGMKEGKEF